MGKPMELCEEMGRKQLYDREMAGECILKFCGKKQKGGGTVWETQ
jgi:hypothetical protein